MVVADALAAAAGGVVLQVAPAAPVVVVVVVAVVAPVPGQVVAVVVVAARVAGLLQRGRARPSAEGRRGPHGGLSRHGCSVQIWTMICQSSRTG